MLTNANGIWHSLPQASMAPVSPHHRYSCHEHQWHRSVTPHHRYSCHKHQWHRSVHITGIRATSINGTGQSTSPVFVPRASTTPVSPHHRYPYHEHQRHRSVHITGRLIGWLVFNGTFSTKKLYCAMQNVKVW